jgi:outer membrane protein
MKTRTLKPAIALALVAASPLAVAYDAGSWLTRFGYAVVAPDASSTSALGDIVDVDDGSGAGISFTYMINPSLGVEVLGALPFTHDIQGTGALAGVAIGETSHLPPTVSLQWYPAMGGKWQPYVGAGLNYTIFFDESTTPAFTTALAGVVPGTTRSDVSLDDSIGLALQLGVDYAVNDAWLINAAVWNIDIETTADVSANGARAVLVDVAIDPWVYMIGAGYRF